MSATEHPNDGLAPLAARCSLCGAGYAPTMAIDITDEPMESPEGDLEYRWCHEQCDRDHRRVFVEAFGTDPADAPVADDPEAMLKDLKAQVNDDE